MARAAGHKVSVWDRKLVPYGDESVMSSYLESLRASALINLAIASGDTPDPSMTPQAINQNLPALLGSICAQQGIGFVHTSSVMVFEDSGQGPFSISSKAAAPDGYGRDKRLAEEHLVARCSQGIIARLGWQIGTDLTGNSMAHFLADAMETKGSITASSKWFPACSFVIDTAAVLVDLALEDQNHQRPEAQQGVRIEAIDGNRGWSFFEIAQALGTFLNQQWTFQRDDSFVYDQRMIGGFLATCDLSKRLALRAL